MNYKTYRVNFVNGLLWLKPGFFKSLISNRGYNYRPFYSIKDLINELDIQSNNCYFIFNENEFNWKFFNELMNLKNINFQLNKSVVNQINEKEYINTKINDELEIKWDLKALKTIKKGYLPFFNLNYFEILYKEIIKFRNNSDLKPKITISWRKNGFIFNQFFN